jgi:hypothetical protein
VTIFLLLLINFIIHLDEGMVYQPFWSILWKLMPFVLFQKVVWHFQNLQGPSWFWHQHEVVKLVFFLSCSLNEELISMWVSSCTSFRWCMIVDSSFVFITILFEDCTFSCHSVAISLRDSSFKVSCEQMMASIVSSGSLYKVARSLSFQNFVLSKLLIAFKITNCFS